MENKPLQDFVIYSEKLHWLLNNDILDKNEQSSFPTLYDKKEWELTILSCQRMKPYIVKHLEWKATMPNWLLNIEESANKHT